MKTLLAIISCHTKAEMRDVIRETWIPQIPEGTDYRFFIGRSDTCVPAVDEVILDCNDSYGGLIEKIRAVVRWALAQGYDFMMKIDDDVVVRPVALMASGFDKYNFVGADNGDMHKDICDCGKTDCRQLTGKYITPWGFHYILSKQAMELVSVAELPKHGGNDECWVASVLGERGIMMHHDDRFIIHTGMNPNEEPWQEAPLDKQYTYANIWKTVDKPGRLGRKHTVMVRERIELPMTDPAPSGMQVLPNETHRKNGWLVRSKFTEVQATPETFSFAMHLVWEGYHLTPKETVIAEFKKVFADPSIVWFDRRCFGGGSWREV